MGGADNKWGLTKLKVASAREVDITDALIFVVFLVKGLVPPFSSFLRAILEHFQVHTPPSPQRGPGPPYVCSFGRGIHWGEVVADGN